jgi:hypothetical protein
VAGDGAVSGVDDAIRPREAFRKDLRDLTILILKGLYDASGFGKIGGGTPSPIPPGMTDFERGSCVPPISLDGRETP